MKKEKIFASIFAAILSFSAPCLPINAIGADVSADSVLITFSDADEKTEDNDFLLGDVDNDHVITPRDASLALSEYALFSTTGKGSFSEAEKKRADVDNNKWIDPADASYILSYYAYLSTGGQISMEEYMKNPFMPPMTTTTTTTVTTASTAKETKTTAAPKTTSATDSPKTTTVKPKPTTTTTTKPKPTATTTTTTKPKPTATTTTTTKPKPTATTTTTTQPKPTATTTTTTQPKPTATTTTTAQPKPTTTTTTTTTTTSSTTTTSYADPYKVASIDLTRTELAINVGEGALSAYVTMNPPTAKNKAEKWTSSDESIAIVDGEGWVIGKKEGTCIITVTSVDNPEVSAKITLKVIDKTHVKEIRLSRDSMTVKAGEGALSAYVTMLPETALNKNEIWSSSDESVAIVDSEGWVIGKKAGTCQITVKSADNPSVSAVISVTVTDGNSTTATTASTASSTTTTASSTTVSTDSTTTTTESTGVKVTEIRLSKTEITVPIGGTDISWVTMLPSDAQNKDEIWVSSDESIATVDKYGWIRGISVGKCTVTVISANNPDVNAKISVTVVDSMENPPQPDVLFSSIAPNQPDGNYIAFKTPLPENIKGRFVIDYIITDDNGIVTSIQSPVILLPEMESVITNLKADTNKFTAVGYITNLTTGERVELGRYSFVISPRDAQTQTENIKDAFERIS